MTEAAGYTTDLGWVPPTDWTFVGHTTEDVDAIPFRLNTSTSSTWSFDTTYLNSDGIDVLYGLPGQQRHAVMFTTYEPDLPFREPTKRNGRRTARQYRAARRAYGRSVRAWKRAGRPRRVAWKGYLPNVALDVERTGITGWTITGTLM